MKKIIFLRPALYLDRISGKDIISSFDLIGSQKCDPKINTENINTKERINCLLKKFIPAKIYSSSAMRCTDTAELFGLVFGVSPLLNEIKFSLTGTLSSALLNTDNTNVNRLRTELVNAFVQNKTKESPTEVIIRIKSFLEVLKNTKGNIFCISHAFIMKFYEIFFRNNGVIKGPVSFLSEYNWEIKPYEFLDGFCVLMDDAGKVHHVELLKDLL